MGKKKGGGREKERGREGKLKIPSLLLPSHLQYPAPPQYCASLNLELRAKLRKTVFCPPWIRRLASQFLPTRCLPTGNLLPNGYSPPPL